MDVRGLCDVLKIVLMDVFLGENQDISKQYLVACNFLFAQLACIEGGVTLL